MKKNNGKSRGGILLSYQNLRPPIFTAILIWIAVSYANAQLPSAHRVSGKVTSSKDGSPIAGTSIRIKKGVTQALADGNGEFNLNTNSKTGILQISCVGFRPLEVTFDLNKETTVSIQLQEDVNSMNEVQVIGYGKVSKRFNTGSVVTVNAEDIERQAVSNPLAALAGRVPGMTVEQSSGNPGGKFNIQIRGQSSISQGSQPLFLIDGIPYPNDQITSGMTGLANQGQSPMSNINPLDIESIEILKDADATAVYGSRGANGVILITTKKGKTGATRMDASVYHGAGQVTRRLELLNTQQYLTMRKEAFANDGVEPTATNAPDIVLWDTTRYTDWQDLLIGGTAHFTNANASLSGGSPNTQFLVSANYHRQGSVYPGNYENQQGKTHFNLSHTSQDNRFTAIVAGNYSLDKNELPGYDLTNSITISPNNPPLFDEDGNLNWEENGGAFSNPLTYLKKKASATTDVFRGNVNLQYKFLEELSLKLAGGYNVIQFNQMDTSPKASLDPNSNTTPSSRFAKTTNKSWIFEPQLEYTRHKNNGKLSILLGASLQNDVLDANLIVADGFSNDAVIEAVAFANSITGETSHTTYSYQALFGRINYIYNNKYLLNITGRRDGSSRFGPEKRVANFGAIGTGWIFSEENFIKRQAKWLSFGKLRASYGITGNDQIGDYQFLDNYRANPSQYEGQVGYIPSRLFNADYTWERNRKLETGLEIGLLENAIFFNANWFRHRSDSQLINYRLPNQVGFSSILRNYGALVQNMGWEFTLSATAVKQAEFSWSSSVNLTVNKNKLLDFPGLETSSYANSLVIGKPLNIVRLIQYTGVDMETGIHVFNGTSLPDDQIVVADFTPKFHGGLSNDIVFGNWNFSFLLQFVKQDGYNYLRSLARGSAPGTRRNQPIEVLDRWQYPGQATNVQRFTTTGTPSTAFNNYIAYSDAPVSDASFIRLKNLYISYSLPKNIIRHIRLKETRLYFQGQNLFTLTSYRGLDPETGRHGSMTLPTLAVYTFGIHLSL